MPTDGLFAASVAVVNPQSNWSGPAFAFDGFRGNETMSESDEAVQGELLIVQNNT